MDTGIKFSKFNYNVEGAKFWKMLMYSVFPLLKLKQSATGDITKATGDASITITIPHNLGYVPICYVFGKYLDYDGNVSSKYQLFSRFEYAGLQVYNEHYYYADDTNLYIVHTTVNYVDHSYVLPYYYYIFYDEENN